MNEVVKAIIERASCKQFKPEHVSREELDLIVKAGLNAPTGGNKQRARFVVVTNSELVKKLSKMNGAVVNAPIDVFYGAPDVILCFATKDGDCVQDGSLAMGNMLNAAYALGLGARWINRAKEMFETEEGMALLKEWGVTEDVQGIGCCIVGYPDMELVAKDIIPGRVYYVD